MSDYELTTEEVRTDFVMLNLETGVNPAPAFDRWLSEVKAAAWDEGYLMGAIAEANGKSLTNQNPYRT